MPAVNGGPATKLVEDDGQTLWTSPTAGSPVDLSYLPSGGQLFLVLRPADLLTHDEGQRLLDALGPARDWAQDRLRTVLGVELNQVEQLTIAFVPDDSLQPQAAYVMRLAEEIPLATLRERWGGPAAEVHQGKKYFQRGGLAYYLPESDNGRTVAVTPAAMIRQVLELDGQPLLRSGIENLLRHSDRQRQVTLLFTPSFLLTDGRELLVGHLQRLHAPLREFLDERIEAVMVSAAHRRRLVR